MFTQRADELHSHVNTDGCALMSIAYAVSVYKPKKMFTPKLVNGVYRESLKKGLMGERSYIKDWAGVFGLFDMKVEYLGWMDCSWTPGDGEFEIVKWVLSIPHERIDWQHFTFGGDPNTTKHQFYDPWGSAKPGYHLSRTVEEGVIENKRGFRILEEGWQ
jgi:hypothetical protein